MLQDLDDTLKELLSRELPTELVQQINFSFDTPDKESIAKQKTTSSSVAINLFLYDIRENLELRNSVRTWEQKSEGKAFRKRTPLRVDCSYIVTVWSTQDSEPREEHRLLGEVMKVLLRYPKIPAEILQGSLKEQTLLLPTTSLRSSQLQSSGEFWQAMGGKPKATLNYTVTISVQVDEIDEQIPLAMDSQIKMTNIN